MAKTNTIKSILGFFKAVLQRRLPFLSQDSSLEAIYNYVPIKDLYATSGQPNERQFDLIKQAGFTTVINLAPTSVLENSVVEEAAILERLGMEYVHIPVDFKNPTDEDFAQFVGVLNERDGQQVWVHCAANMRVSAFTYRYREQILQHDPGTARLDLEKIWEPFGVWVDFIKNQQAH
ncbi:MAG: protein tyrosine phosphatase family protein [Pseudomonadota bacterium]